MFDYPGAIRQPTVFTMADGWRACIWLPASRGSRLVMGEADSASDAIALAVQKAEAMQAVAR